MTAIHFLLILASLGTLYFWGKYHKEKLLRKDAQSLADSWKAKYNFEEETRRKAQDEVFRYKQAEKERIEQKRDELAMRGIDLGLLSEDKPWGK